MKHRGSHKDQRKRTPAFSDSAVQSHDLDDHPLVCSEADVSGQLYPLEEISTDQQVIPPTGQYIRIEFNNFLDGVWRFLVWRGDGSPSEHVCQATSINPFQGIVWKGGALWYSFQHCVDGEWRDVAGPVATEDPEGPGAFRQTLTLYGTEDVNGPKSVANIEWAPGLGAPALPETTSVYTLVFETVKCVHRRSGTFQNDTNYASMIVYSPLQGVARTNTKSLGDMSDELQLSVGLSIGNVAVPLDKSVTVAWTVINSGNQTPAQLDKAIQTALEQVVQSAVDSNDDDDDNDEILAKVAKALIDLAVGFFGADCDGPVVFQRMTLKGSDLEAWTTNDLKKWVSPEITDIGDADWGKSPLGCGGSDYWTQISATKQPRPN